MNLVAWKMKTGLRTLILGFQDSSEEKIMVVAQMSWLKLGSSSKTVAGISVPNKSIIGK